MENSIKSVAWRKDELHPKGGTVEFYVPKSCVKNERAVIKIG